MLYLDNGLGRFNIDNDFEHHLVKLTGFISIPQKLCVSVSDTFKMEILTIGRNKIGKER